MIKEVVLEEIELLDLREVLLEMIVEVIDDKNEMFIGVGVDGLFVE